MEQEMIIKILDKWNPWNQEINGGKPRPEYVKKLYSSISGKEALILQGVRRCGKSTILRQLINELLQNDVKKEQILFVNFEDYNFVGHLELNLLEGIFEAYRKKFPHKERIYCFLDEIQLISRWERWVRTLYDQEIDIKFIITGSSAHLLTKELSTLMTGRNLTFEIRPLSYREFKSFNKKAKIEEYLTYGGFPEVVLEKDVNEKEKRLRQYFLDILHKDIIDRYNIRNANQLINLAQYLISNPGAKLSSRKLSNTLGVSKDTISTYINYMVDAYLLIEVPFFSYSVKKRHDVTKLPKYYVVDNGLINVSNIKFSKNTGLMYENAVLLKLIEQKNILDVIMYWSELKSEVDFVANNKAINVTATEKVPEREFKGLEDIKKKHKHVKTLNIIYPGKEKQENGVFFINIESFFEIRV